MVRALSVLGLTASFSFGSNGVKQTALINNPESGTIVGWYCNWDSEDNWCAGWQNVDFSQEENYNPADHFDWVVRRGSSLSPATGPASDHTTRTPEGQYLVMIGRDKKFLSRAEIRSPSIDLSAFEEYCFSMWYHMFGRHTFSLNVYISIPTTRGDKEMVFKDSGSVSKNAGMWVYKQQTIKRPRDWDPATSPGPHYSHILVKGVRGLSYQSDIAIDDLKFEPGPCGDVIPTDPTTTQATTTLKATVATTRRTTTTYNPMVTREYQPFYKPSLEDCEISTPDGVTVTERYYTQMHVCCGGKISSRMNGGKCCNGVQFFERKQECCNGAVINKLKYGCCNNEPTELTEGNYCCGGKSYPKADSSTKCCGGELTYNPSEKGCCEGSTNSIFDLGTERCCGGKIQSKTDMDVACCGEGKIGTEYRPGGNFGCCNGNTFYVVDYGCCGGTYVFYKLHEECLDPDCTGDKCPEKPATILEVKKKDNWRRVFHRASKYLFTYKSKRKRRDISPAEGIKYFEKKRSKMVLLK